MIVWRHRRSWTRGLVWAAVVLLGAWVAGFVGFVRSATLAPPAPAHADGIVALTGGAGRVEAALHLLASDRADGLLISGIGPGIELAALAHRAGLDPGPLADRVTLGRQATSTRGNAVETLAWVRARHIHTLIVVTAWYHMPRALIELGRAMPNVVLDPAPVDPEASHQPGLALARLLMEEYTKYLAAWLGLTAVIPEREPAPGMRSTHQG
jgi:uncharacterized SAM-binding protein YcdF (DUF218 family)